MFAQAQAARNTFLKVLAFLSLAVVTACDLPVNLAGGGSEPVIDTGAPVQVALLVPRGSGQSSDDFLAANLENAARLAIADLQGVQIDLRVYSTGGNATQAAGAAQTAVAEGAQIIIGPLYAEAANAAGVAVSNQGVNVLAFSNNTAIAGGNVFVLGPTFENTASRLVRYSTQQGVNRFMIVHGDDVGGQAGRDAIASAVRANGGSISGIESYPLSQQGILNSVPAIASSTRGSGAQAVFMTAGVNADLPILATALPDNGISPSDVQFIGLTRWSAAPQALSLPGLQGGIFALPDQATQRQFEARYNAAYGSEPHPLAGLAYDGIAAVGALVASGDNRALTRSSLTQRSGFQGTQGIFRLNSDGSNERGLAVATVQNSQVVILQAAPGSFGGAGF